jgi:hypothetical protein
VHGGRAVPKLSNKEPIENIVKREAVPLSKEGPPIVFGVDFILAACCGRITTAPKTAERMNGSCNVTNFSAFLVNFSGKASDKTNRRKGISRAGRS